MQYLIGIDIPAELKEKIAAFGESCGVRLKTPRIMLVGPKRLEGSRGIANKLQSFCLAQPAFRVTVGGPAIFGEKSLCLTVLPGVINMARERLAAKLTLPPENMVYRPHITMFRKTPGSEDAFAELLLNARQMFTGPYTFAVDEIAMYSRPGPDAEFELVKLEPLTGR